MHLSFRLTTNLPNKRGLNAMQKRAWKATGEFWHGAYLPRHFTNAAVRLYGYAPRQGQPGSGYRGRFEHSYTGRKLELWGHTRPLEWSGVSKELAMRRVVTSTSKGMKVKSKAPLFNRSVHKKINMLEEAGRVIPTETRAMVKLFLKRLVMLIRKDRNIRRIDIR